MISLLLVTPAAAPAEPPTVLVPGTKIAIGWPYHVLAAGIEAFDDERTLAPRAVLRFRLLLAPGVATLDNVALTLVDGERLAPVPLTAEGYFTLDHRPLANNAELAVNRNAAQFDGNRTPQPDVRTVGLPHNVRRLGDLRLECRVKMAMAKELLGFMQSLALSALGGADWCAPRKGNAGYTLQGLAPVVRATLADGARSIVLAVKNGSAITVPVADRAWDDEALVTLDYGPD
jgi:hypothetical protein